MTEFLLLATILLAVGVLAVPIATRLGLGSVLGYLIAGMAISPALETLGVDVIALQHFAEFGVVMMLFLIGLELEPKKLWDLRVRLLGLGGGGGLDFATWLALWENYVVGQMGSDAEPVAYEGRDGALVAGFVDGDKFYADMTGNGVPDSIYIQGADGTVFRDQGSGFKPVAKPWVGSGPFG